MCLLNKRSFCFVHQSLFFFLGLLDFSILRPQSRSHGFCSQVFYLFFLCFPTSFLSLVEILCFPTSFLSLVEILKYLHSYHFLIFAPNMACDPSQGYFTKEKKTLHLKLGLQRTYSSLGDIKNNLFSFQERLIRTNKF